MHCRYAYNTYLADINNSNTNGDNTWDFLAV